MNKDTERKLDELLAKMPKHDYDLDAWLNEDETAEFDRLQQTNTDLHGGKKNVWRWVAAAACLLIIIGIGVTMKPIRQEPESNPMIAENNAQPLPSLAQPLPSEPCPYGEGLGVGPLALEEERKLQTLPHPSGTPPRKGRVQRGVATPRREVVQTSQQDVTADTLGSSIWQREENVVLALQMLSDCEQTIEREEQELRNNIIRATFNATPQPAKARLLLNDNGDYMVVEDNGPVIIEL